MNDQKIIEIARIKLPLVVEALGRANLEVQKQKPDLKQLEEILAEDALDGYFDITDLMSARRTNMRVLADHNNEPKAKGK